jgi:hypothetical protein
MLVFEQPGRLSIEALGLLNLIMADWQRLLVNVALLPLSSHLT